jgi:S1-C subfamily serine protease
MGVELQPMTRELARANAVSDQTHDGLTGALVTYVHPGSPANQAGIKPGAILLRLRAPARPLPVDVLVEEDYFRVQAFPWDRLDGLQEQAYDKIPTPWPPVENNFTRTLTDFGFGTKYAAEFSIDGQIVSKEFEVVASPVHFESAPRYKAESVGVTVRNISYEVRRYLQRKSDEPGVVVSKVETGSRASIAGVKPYEVITHVNDQPVSNVKDFEEAISGGGELRLSIKRMAKGRIVTIKPPAGSGT